MRIGGRSLVSVQEFHTSYEGDLELNRWPLIFPNVTLIHFYTQPGYSLHARGNLSYILSNFTLITDLEMELNPISEDDEDEFEDDRGDYWNCLTGLNPRPVSRDALFYDVIPWAYCLSSRGDDGYYMLPSLGNLQCK